MSSRSSSSARRLSISSKIVASASARVRSNCRHSLPRCRNGISVAGLEVTESISFRRRASPSSCGPASRPNTARRITSSVNAWKRGCSSIGCPVGHEAASCSATSCIVLARRCIFSPWKAGSISLRWLRCSPWSRRITEFLPTSGSRMRAPSPGCSTAGSAVKTSFTCAGSAIITKGGVARRRIVKRLPYSARHRSRNETGRAHQAIVCSALGWRGPGGSVARAGTPLPLCAKLPLSHAPQRAYRHIVRAATWR